MAGCDIAMRIYINIAPLAGCRFPITSGIYKHSTPEGVDVHGIFPDGVNVHGIFPDGVNVDGTFPDVVTCTGLSLT